MVKPKKEGAEQPKKGMLDNVDLGLESSFTLQELRLKGGMWTLKLVVRESLPETYRHYDMLMSYDEQPQQDRIDKIEADLAAGLFKDDATEARNEEKSVERIKQEMQKQHDLCKPIGCVVTILEVKYIDAGTQIMLIVEDSIVKTLNDMKGRLKQYKVRLDPRTV